MEAERNRLGWSKTKLADEVRAKLGDSFSRATPDRLKTQKRPPQPATINAIAEILGIPLTEAHLLAGLLDASEASTQPQGMTVVDVVRVDAETEALLAKLSPKRRAFLERVREEERLRLQDEVRMVSRRFADRVRLEADEDDHSD